ncbi:MAG: GNAT family N-acetyltransferase, partial [Deferribacteraceae bacterium]|nr:GNAT family N-acetyltransferase [Deferribacteraceae bacterium]
MAFDKKSIMDIKLRSAITKADEEIVRNIISGTGFFRDEEIIIAVSLVTETLKDPNSGYLFVFAEEGGDTAGYAVYGAIPGAIGSFELYWIAVKKELQGKGIGKMLIKAVEDMVRSENGRHLYITTSGMDLYKPTRALYEKLGYETAATLPDYFVPGDARVIY